jgi:hypothetical protein
MPVSYEKNKEHIYKWRENNKSEYNTYMRKLFANLPDEARDKIRQRRRELYALRKDVFYLECERFRRIELI